jgi:Ca2+-binding EF-hand superfamily protein
MRAEARRLFEMFDTNNDGLLEEPELRRMAAHLGTNAPWSRQGKGVDRAYGSLGACVCA